ncbi:MAG: hypothetical protein KGH60_01070 [Candidatus Micrarchaeota archaeon]|nr:hypothetical protein [Candidatus Micrarchaeota archaeon]
MPNKLCHICGAITHRTCSMCGRPTCEKHFVKGKGICDVCGRGRQMK